MLAAAGSACDSGSKTAGNRQAKKRQAILADAKADMLAIEKITTDPAGFKQALAGQALKDFNKKFNDDSAAGKVHIRSYEKLKVKFIDLAKGGLARVETTFVDNSHYAPKDNPRAPVGIPESHDKKFMLHLMKVGKRWKIVAVANAE